MNRVRALAVKEEIFHDGFGGFFWLYLFVVVGEAGFVFFVDGERELLAASVGVGEDGPGLRGQVEGEGQRAA